MVLSSRLETLAAAADQIAQHRTDDAPKEAVGFVWADGTITRLVNQATSNRYFYIDVDQVAAVLASTDDPPVALYHTHAGTAHPSDHDRTMMDVMARNPGWDAVMFAIYGDDGLAVWNLQDGDSWRT